MKWVIIIEHLQYNKQDAHYQNVMWRSGARQPFVVVGDLTKEEDVRRMIDSTVEHFGRLDILVRESVYGQFPCRLEGSPVVWKVPL